MVPAMAKLGDHVFFSLCTHSRLIAAPSCRMFFIINAHKPSSSLLSDRGKRTFLSNSSHRREREHDLTKQKKRFRVKSMGRIFLRKNEMLRVSKQCFFVTRKEFFRFRVFMYSAAYVEISPPFKLISKCLICSLKPRCMLTAFRL